LKCRETKVSVHGLPIVSIFCFQKKSTDAILGEEMGFLWKENINVCGIFTYFLLFGFPLKPFQQRLSARSPPKSAATERKSGTP
jgi:hypothetical protein